jgi:hypothetical protein
MRNLDGRSVGTLLTNWMVESDRLREWRYVWVVILCPRIYHCGHAYVRNRRFHYPTPQQLPNT